VKLQQLWFRLIGRNQLGFEFLLSRIDLRQHSEAFGGN
jgi:hypothetical protein